MAVESIETNNSGRVSDIWAKLKPPHLQNQQQRHPHESCSGLVSGDGAESVSKIPQNNWDFLTSGTELNRKTVNVLIYHPLSNGQTSQASWTWKPYSVLPSSRLPSKSLMSGTVCTPSCNEPWRSPSLIAVGVGCRVTQNGGLCSHRTCLRHYAAFALLLRSSLQCHYAPHLPYIGDVAVVK